MEETERPPAPMRNDELCCPDQLGYLNFQWRCDPVQPPLRIIGFPQVREPVSPRFGVTYNCCCPPGEMLPFYWGSEAAPLGDPPAPSSGGGGALRESISARPTVASRVGAFDTFDRPDSPEALLLKADTGQAWLNPGGVWMVSGGEALSSQLTPEGCLPVALVDTGLADGWVEVTLSAPPSAKGTSRLVFRAASVENYLYLERRFYNDTPELDGYYLCRYYAGATTVLGYCCMPGAASGDVLSVCMLEKQIAASLNGFMILSVTDETNHGYTQHGFSGSEYARFQEFVVRSSAGAICVSDRFRPASAALGVSSSGHTWCSRTAALWRLQGGRAVVAHDLPHPVVATLDAEVADGLVSVKLSEIGAVSSRVVFRYTDDQNYLYADANQHSVHLGMRCQGEEKPLLPPQLGPTEGRLLRVQMSGRTVRFYLDGRPSPPVDVSFNLLATRHGMGTSASRQVMSQHAFEDFQALRA